MMSCWTPANITVVDETLVPFKGRNNPHHVFIMRKSNPHGLKNWLLVDYSGYFFTFSLFRHDRSGQQQTYEAADQTLLRMASVLPPGTLICADSYFGSLKALEGLAKQGKYGLFSCNSKQDTFIFKEDLHKKVNGDGESSSLYGSVEGMSGERVPFIANCFQSEGRKLNTMGSVYLDVLSERTSAEKVWEIIMLLSINAKKLHESASGLLERNSDKCTSWKDIWMIWLCEICGPICKNCEKGMGNGQKNPHLKYYKLPTSSWAMQGSYQVTNGKEHKQNTQTNTNE